MWKKRHLKIRLLLYALVAAAIALISPKLLRRHVIYHPSHDVNENTLQELQFYRFAPLSEMDEKMPFRGFIHVPDSPQKIIVIFHGNAGQAADRITLARGFSDKKTVILLAEYPGYGQRTGKPSEAKLCATALDDMKFLKKNFPDLPVIVVGESLGSGVATWLATQFDLSGLILISPFTSLPGLTRELFSGLPLGWFLPDHFDSLARFEALASNTEKKRPPLLVLHGEKDQVVPFSQGQKLFDHYPGPKNLIAVQGAGHNDLPWENTRNEMWKGIQKFTKSLEGKSP